MKELAVLIVLIVNPYEGDVDHTVHQQVIDAEACSGVAKAMTALDVSLRAHDKNLRIDAMCYRLADKPGPHVNSMMRMPSK